METNHQLDAASRTWSFYNPTRIHFGLDARSAAVDLVTSGRTLIVSSRRGRAQLERDSILGSVAAGDVAWVDDVESNPSLSALSRLQQDPELAGIDAIIAFGGGSSMDSAKAVSAMLACRREAVDLREIVGRPGILDHFTCPPVHCIPTTAGTGAEVTPFATIWDHDARKKLSLFHPALYPRTAIVDPRLALDLPEDVTLASALDALNQAFESVWNRNASSYTVRLAGLAIEKGMRGLSLLASDLRNLEGRSQMAEASLLAGLCISQTRTAICHSISYPLTAHFHIPHGIACAFTMKAVVEEIRRELPDLFSRLAPLAGYGDPGSMIRDLESVLSQPPVRRQWEAAQSAPDAVKALVGEMRTPGRSDNFILPVDETRLLRILDTSLRQ